MNSLKVITTSDMKQLNKFCWSWKEEPRKNELLMLINKVAWARGQDTLLTTAQAHTMAERLAAETATWDYNLSRFGDMDAKIRFPLRTGPAPSKKAGLAAAAVSIAGAAAATGYTAYSVADALVKGNLTLDVAAGVGLVSAAVYGVAGGIKKIVTYVSKTRREIYQKFAKNIEANIVLELDLLFPQASKGEGTESHPLRIKNEGKAVIGPLQVEKIAAEHEQEGIKPEDMDDPLSP